MRVTVFTANPDLADSLSIMLDEPALGVGVEIASSWPGPQHGDVAIVDAQLPLRALDKICEALDGVPAHPVIVISGPMSAEWRLPGLADRRHLTLPFHRRDLVVAMDAAGADILRDVRTELRWGGLSLEMRAREAHYRDDRVPLTGKELELLELLMLHAGEPLSKQRLLETLYGSLDQPEPKIIDVFICKIRRKIKKLTGGDGMIDTVWGRGYMLRGELHEGGAARRALR